MAISIGKIYRSGAICDPIMIFKVFVLHRKDMRFIFSIQSREGGKGKKYKKIKNKGDRNILKTVGKIWDFSNC